MVSSAPRVERVCQLDVNEMHKAGAFRRLTRFELLGLITDQHAMLWRPAKWEAGRPAQRIEIEWTRCRLGGARPWFICPCSRRVGRLYFGGGNNWLGCRTCAGLKYESQSKSRPARLFQRAQKLRAKLRNGGHPGFDPVPSRRPWGMRQKTFDRLRSQIIEIEVGIREGRRGGFTRRFRT